MSKAGHSLPGVVPGLTARGLSGQPEGQIEQINVALTLQLVKAGTNFQTFFSLPNSCFSQNMQMFHIFDF